MILNYIKKLEIANHFDNDRHQCNGDCEFFKNEIAFCARKLVIPPQHRFQYEVTVVVLLGYIRHTCGCRAYKYSL